VSSARSPHPPINDITKIVPAANTIA
jgi:hypothetical protein